LKTFENHKPQELGRSLGDVTMLPVKTGDASKDGDGTSGWTNMSMCSMTVLGWFNSSWFNGQLIIQQKGFKSWKSPIVRGN